MKMGKKENLCENCEKSKKNGTAHPSWVDSDGIEHFELPNELAHLREAEKLLIQIVDVYVPMLHLQYGQIGSRGHVCSFAKDMSEIVHDLPRLPDQVRYYFL